jgi:arginine N-succinyltransferase
MMIVREVGTEDLDALWDLIGQANLGMTSLKIDKEQLADRIERSHFAFRRTNERAEGAPYVLVMQDTATGALVGTSCIFSKTGGFEPFYAYRVVSEVVYCERLKVTNETHSLHLVKIHNGPTEIGSLFLLPEYRGRGCGKLLSMSRFAYMAAHPKRFASHTIAEMRGNIGNDDSCPFWNAIGAHFFKIDFPSADTLSMIDKQFIEDLMPKYPIYLELLPKDAVDSIGVVHDQTKPALAMLEAQGFARNGLIDIFDGGPVVECKTEDIAAIRRSRPYRLAHENEFTNSIENRRMAGCIVSTSQSPFVSIQCDVRIANDFVIMDPICVEALGCKPGATVWVT